MPELEPITREEMLLDGEDLTPITRKEKFIKRIYDKTQEVPEPITREEYFLKKAGEGGGGDIDLQTLNVTENGTVIAPSGVAYDKVVTNVPSVLPENAYLLEEYEDVPTDIASFTASDAPLKSLTASIVPVQSGSGDPSPTNVRPISGWTGCEVIDDAVYGGFIEWNQLVQNGNFESTTNWVTFRCTLTVNNNIGTLTLGAAPVASAQINQQVNIPSNHKILLCGELNSSVTGDISIITFKSSSGGGTSDAITVNVQANTWTKYNAIRALNTDITKVFAIYAVASENSTLQLKNIQIIDLTQMFGTTIADYIYSLEQATSGSGVAYFKSLFYKDYYPYNSGEITNVSAVNGDTDKYLKYTIPFTDGQGQSVTVYGGEIDVINGVVTPCPYYASYNGEQLTGEWISDRDVYSPNTTPTTGAQVVNIGATGTPFSVQPTSIKSLDGDNNVSASTGQIESLEFFTKEE